MNQSFTGATRKPRQVNLSGRNASNPWANLPGSQKGSSTSAGAQSTVAQAQAERLRRQQERERLNAAKAIQRVSRGHASRKISKQQLRAQWDGHESERLGLQQDVDYTTRVQEPDNAVPPYASEAELWLQTRLITHFLDVRDSTDRMRLLYFGDVLQRTPPIHVLNCPSMPGALSRISLKLLDVMRIDGARENELFVPKMQKDLRLLSFLADKFPGPLLKHASKYFNTLRHVLDRDSSDAEQETTHSTSAGSQIAEDLVTAACALLRTDQDYGNTNTYTAFATAFMTSSRLSLPMLHSMSNGVDLGRLSDAIIHHLHGSSPTGHFNKAEDSLTLLAHFIYLFKLGSQLPAYKSRQRLDHIQALSVLMGVCADEVATRVDVLDPPALQVADEIAPSVREQILSVREPKHIDQVLFTFSQSEKPASEIARVFANYALNMLRAFPNRAPDIRMRLYSGSVALTATEAVSTLEYLWQASQRTEVFRRILDKQRHVLATLRCQPPEAQLTFGPSLASSNQVESSLRDDWRVVLLFFELYTSALKLMDDDEFFSRDEAKIDLGNGHPGRSGRGALPLRDIRRMVSFLKRLAFTLYWNAADLTSSNDDLGSDGISAYFEASAIDHAAKMKQPRGASLAGLEGVSQPYLKGLFTGVLRMLHERHSRRNFLPAQEWLATGQVDMMSFIPAVVAEEERRHEMGEDITADGDDLDYQDEEADQDGDGDMFGAFSRRHGLSYGAPSGGSAQRLHAYLRRQAQARIKRQQASLIPRLEILRNLPFFIPFETRVQIFREFVYRDQMRRRDGHPDPETWRFHMAHGSQGRGPEGRNAAHAVLGEHRAEIRRESVFEDAYASFYDLGERLKEPIQISFIDKFGQMEAGIDGGGVTKEFLTSVTTEAFSPQCDPVPYFVANPDNCLYPNPDAFDIITDVLRQKELQPKSEAFRMGMRDSLQRFEFLGRIVGKCLYEGILIDINFANFFLLKWALTGGTTSASNESAYRATINDIRDLDQQLYRGLLDLKNYPGNVEADFGLNFTITDSYEIPSPSGALVPRINTHELKERWGNVAVTNTNRLIYIDLVAKYRLQGQPRFVTNAFLKGLGQIIQPMWLAMFNQKELQTLIGGDNNELDIADLRRNTQYGGLYVVGHDGLEHPTVALFWQVLKDMSDPDRRKVLKFVTSTPRAPLLGFSNLHPRFSIRDSTDDQDRLPSTSTCVNLLKLPRYDNEQVMREKLLYAVNAGAGFDLS